MNRSFWLIAPLLYGCTRDDGDAVSATGSIEVVEVDVAPMVTGRVVRVLVDDGDSASR